MMSSGRDAAVAQMRIREATPEEVELVRPDASAEGVSLDPSDAARPTTWWVAVLPDDRIIGICGMMPVEDGGQRLRGSWVSTWWRRRGVWWTMVEHRLQIARDRGANFAETYAVHPGPMLRRGWEVASTKHRHGAVHVRIYLQDEDYPPRNVQADDPGPYTL